MDEWKKLPADGCKRLLDGYQEQLEAVIVAKGSSCFFLLTGRFSLALSPLCLLSVSGALRQFYCLVKYNFNEYISALKI